MLCKVSKGAKIRNRYNQVHPPQSDVVGLWYAIVISLVLVFRLGCISNKEHQVSVLPGKALRTLVDIARLADVISKSATSS